MILHIADDDKFIDQAIELFETVSPGKNIYLINHKSLENLHFIKYRGDRIYVFPYKSKEYAEIIKRSFKAVIFHSFNDYKWELVKYFPENVHLHWLSWGFDFYGIPILRKNLLLPATNRIYINNFKPKDKFYLKLSNNFPGLWNILNYVRYGGPSEYFKLNKAVRRIKSVSTVIEDEFLLVQKYLNQRMVYIPFRIWFHRTIWERNIK